MLMGVKRLPRIPQQTGEGLYHDQIIHLMSPFSSTFQVYLNPHGIEVLNSARIGTQDSPSSLTNKRARNDCDSDTITPSSSLSEATGSSAKISRSTRPVVPPSRFCPGQADAGSCSQPVKAGSAIVSRAKEDLIGLEIKRLHDMQEDYAPGSVAMVFRPQVQAARRHRKHDATQSACPLDSSIPGPFTSYILVGTLVKCKYSLASRLQGVKEDRHGLAVVVGMPKFNQDSRSFSYDVVWVYQKSNVADEVLTHLNPASDDVFSVVSVSEDFPHLLPCTHKIVDRHNIMICVEQIFAPPTPNVEVVALSTIREKIPLSSICEVLPPLQRRCFVERPRPGTPNFDRTQYVYSHEISLTT